MYNTLDLKVETKTCSSVMSCYGNFICNKECYNKETCLFEFCFLARKEQSEYRVTSNLQERLPGSFLFIHLGLCNTFISD